MSAISDLNRSAAVRFLVPPMVTEDRLKLIESFMATEVTAQTIVDYIKANPQTTMDEIEGEFTAYCMMHYERVQNTLLRSKRVKFDDSAFVARAWQEYILQKIRADADDRTIYWVTDAVGEAGKSRLAKHLVAEHKAIQLGGRHADMALIYRNQPGLCCHF
eukprot:gene1528-32905_t